MVIVMTRRLAQRAGVPAVCRRPRSAAVGGSGVGGGVGVGVGAGGSGVCTPVAVSAVTSGPSSVGIVSVPAAAPAVPGANATVTEQLEPLATIRPEQVSAVFAKPAPVSGDGARRAAPRCRWS